MIKNFKWLLVVALTVAACSSDDDNNGAVEEPVVIVPGTADFSKYVAVGNSLTAGYSDGALYIAGQETSWTKILSDQLALAGGGEFKIPFMSDNNGGLLLGGTMITENRLYYNGTGPVRLAPANFPATTEVGMHLTGPFNNMGVPGAKSFHLLAPGYGNIAGVASGQSNPYFARFASSSSATVLGDAVAQNPTFFTLWIGNNDILSYATSGGVGVNQTGNLNPATYGSNDITDPNVFASVYSQLVTGLTANGAKGVVASIPYVTTIPYFTTVPYNPVPLDADKAAQLNAGYAAYNGGLGQAQAAGLISADEKARRTISFHAGQNAVVMVDSYLTNLSALGLPSYRHATSEDRPVLPSSSFIGTTVGGNPAAINGVSVPLADSWILSKDEAAEVKVAVDAYNVTIKALATSKGLAFMDANALLTTVATQGIPYEGYVLTSGFVVGGAFSLDGVHPTARGYALIANEFSKVINATYGSNLPLVKLTNYPMLRPVNL